VNVVTEFDESQADVIGPETTGRAVRINFLDPTVPFGGDYAPGVVASINVETDVNGNLTEETGAGIDDAVGFSVAINALHNARHGARSIIGHDANSLNPLGLTAREAAIAEQWAAEDAEKTSEAEEAEEAEDQAPRGLYVAAAAGSALTAGLLVAAPAAPANQLPTPPAKIAQPFNFTSEVQPADAPALTPAQVQQCGDLALQRPKVLQPARMSRAGIRTEQNIRFKTSLPEMQITDADGNVIPCAPEETRALHIDQYMKKNGHWVKIGPTHAFGGFGQTGRPATTGGYLFGPTTGRPAYLYDECINGHWQKDKLVVTATLKTGTDGSRKEAAEKEFTYPVSIHGHCAAAVRSRKYWQTHTS
jgi:hypothetical protein